MRWTHMKLHTVRRTRLKGCPGIRRNSFAFGCKDLCILLLHPLLFTKRAVITRLELVGDGTSDCGLANKSGTPSVTFGCSALAPATAAWQISPALRR